MAYDCADTYPETTKMPMEHFIPCIIQALPSREGDTRDLDYAQGILPTSPTHFGFRHTQGFHDGIVPKMPENVDSQQMWFGKYLLQ